MKCLMKNYIMKWFRVNAGLFMFAAGLYLTIHASIGFGTLFDAVLTGYYVDFIAWISPLPETKKRRLSH